MAFTPATLFCVVDWRDSRIFAYRSNDALLTVLAAGYFTTAAKYKLSIGDGIFVYDGAGTETTELVVTGIDANGAATVGIGTGLGKFIPTGGTTGSTLADWAGESLSSTAFSSIQAGIDAVATSGGGTLRIPDGDNVITATLVLKSGVILKGSNRKRCRIVTDGVITKLLQDEQWAGYNEHGGIEGIGFEGDALTTIGVEITQTRYANIKSIGVYDCSGSGAIAIKLHGSEIGGTFRHCIRNKFSDIDIDNCWNGIIMTRATGFTLAEGPNFNDFDFGDISGFRDKGVWVEYGEGNRFKGIRNETTYDNTYAWKIDDNVTTLIDCAADGVMFTSFVRLLTGASGSVDQISVAAVNIMSASVPYNTSLRQTASDVVDNIVAFSGTSGYTAELSTAGADIHIFTAAGAKLKQNAQAIVVTATTITTTDDDILNGGVTGQDNAWGIPEGHAGSNAIGFYVGDNSGVVIINPQGNGPKDRITFQSATAFKKSVVLRNQFNVLSGHVLGSADLKAPTPPTITPATLGDWSVAYAAQGTSYYRMGKLCWVNIRLTFTPTHTIASGNVAVDLPLTAHTQAGVTQDLIVKNSSGGITLPAGRSWVVGTPIQGTKTCYLRAMGTGVDSALLQASNFPTGVEYTLHLSGVYLVD